MEANLGKHHNLSKLTPGRIAITIVVLFASLGWLAFLLTPQSIINAPITIDGWPWFEDEYFNIKFQYPPDWKVEKVDVTNYMWSEDFPGHDQEKVWELRVTPPWKDRIEGVYQRGGIEQSSIIILQPGFVANLGFYSIRPQERKYEEILDQFDGGRSFEIEHHIAYRNDGTMIKLSVGKSQNGNTAGITGVKHFTENQQNPHQNFLFHAFMIWHTQLNNSQEVIMNFITVMQSMQLLDRERAFQWDDFRIPIEPEEYIYPDWFRRVFSD